MAAFNYYKNTYVVTTSCSSDNDGKGGLLEGWDIYSDGSHMRIRISVRW